MIDINTPYSHREFFTPTITPFNSAGALLWPTLVGDFLRPIIELAPMAFWFCFHGSDFQICYAADDFAPIDAAIQTQLTKYKTTEIKERTKTQTVGTAFLGERWTPHNKIGDDVFAAQRSKLVFDFLCSTSALYFHGLVRDGVHWRPETNNDTLQNPEGHSFESILHMLCNISQVPTLIRQFEVQKPSGHIRGLGTSFSISHIDRGDPPSPLVVGPKIPIQF